MKAVIAVLACLVAAVSASCGTLQRLKVKRQWVEAYGNGLQRERLGTTAFKTFFEKEPATPKGVFERVHGDNVNSKEFRAHIVRVLGGLDQCISLLDDEKTLNAQLAHLKKQHDNRAAVLDKYFDEFGTALADAISTRLGRHFDQASFKACYTVITTGIKKKAPA